MIKRFIYKFRFALSIAITPDYVLDADLEGYWTIADAKTLQNFMTGTETGNKIRQILRNYILRSNGDAVFGRITKAHARGIATTVAVLERHFTNIPEPEEIEANQTEAEMDFAQSLGI